MNLRRACPVRPPSACWRGALGASVGEGNLRLHLERVTEARRELLEAAARPLLAIERVVLDIAPGTRRDLIVRAEVPGDGRDINEGDDVERGVANPYSGPPHALPGRASVSLFVCP